MVQPVRSRLCAGSSCVGPEEERPCRRHHRAGAVSHRRPRTPGSTPHTRSRAPPRSAHHDPLAARPPPTGGRGGAAGLEQEVGEPRTTDHKHRSTRPGGESRGAVAPLWGGLGGCPRILSPFPKGRATIASALGLLVQSRRSPPLGGWAGLRKTTAVLPASLNDVLTPRPRYAPRTEASTTTAVTSSAAPASRAHSASARAAEAIGSPRTIDAISS